MSRSNGSGIGCFSIISFIVLLSLREAELRHAGPFSQRSTQNESGEMAEVSGIVAEPSVS